LANDLFVRFLGRSPKAEEHVAFTALLSEGFNTRLIDKAKQVAPNPYPVMPLVTWFNHLQSDANTIQQEHAERVRKGPAPDRRLDATWRERYEDAVWSLINHREFVWNS
jgi:hypothetical protein